MAERSNLQMPEAVKRQLSKPARGGALASSRPYPLPRVFNTNLYCDPPQCQPHQSQGTSLRPTDRHNRHLADLGDPNYDYNEYGFFFTDCAVIEQCNELYGNQYTPSSGSDCCLDPVGPPHDTVTLSHCQSLGTANPSDGHLKPEPQLVPSVLASQTPGLPQVGVDYEDTFPASFFMNPFAVSFPGDIAVPQGFGDIPAHCSDYNDEYEVPADDSYGYLGSNNDSESNPASDNPSPRVAATYPHNGFPTYSPIVPTPAAHRLSEHSSSTPSPLIKVTHPTPSSSSTSTSPLQQASPPKSTAKPSTSITSAPPAPGNGGFQFVDASDRKTITRLRNTIVSRKHRDNKVQRIKELERLLEERDREVEELKRKVAQGKR